MMYKDVADLSPSRRLARRQTLRIKAKAWMLRLGCPTPLKAHARTLEVRREKRPADLLDSMTRASVSGRRRAAKALG